MTIRQIKILTIYIFAFLSLGFLGLTVLSIYSVVVGYEWIAAIFIVLTASVAASPMIGRGFRPPLETSAAVNPAAPGSLAPTSWRTHVAPLIWEITGLTVLGAGVTVAVTEHDEFFTITSFLVGMALSSLAVTYEFVLRTARKRASSKASTAEMG
jgi:hypothetical protein